jgi:hypothetical protein
MTAAQTKGEFGGDGVDNGYFSHQISTKSICSARVLLVRVLLCKWYAVKERTSKEGAVAQVFIEVLLAVSRVFFFVSVR